MYWVNTYLTEPQFINSGFAITNFDGITGEIFSSDIVMLGSEINKYFKRGASVDYVQNIVKRVFAHEMGHFLGLDHNFGEKDSDKLSIMSYNEVYELGNYDESAIFELYRDQVDQRAIAHQNEDEYFLSRKLNATSMAAMANK